MCQVRVQRSIPGAVFGVRCSGFGVRANRELNREHERATRNVDPGTTRRFAASRGLYRQIAQLEDVDRSVALLMLDGFPTRTSPPSPASARQRRGQDQPDQGGAERSAGKGRRIMKLDEVIEGWRSQDASTFFGVDETLLHQALRQDHHRERQKRDRVGLRRWGRWRGGRHNRGARGVCAPPVSAGARAALWRLASGSPAPSYRAARRRATGERRLGLTALAGGLICAWAIPLIGHRINDVPYSEFYWSPPDRPDFRVHLLVVPAVGAPRAELVASAPAGGLAEGARWPVTLQADVSVSRDG
jgi:hypothetical protein